MTKLEILEETVAFYSEDVDRRAYTEGEGCVYNTEDGKHCAVGRCLLPKLKELGTGFVGNFSTAVSELADRRDITNLDSLLQEKYRGHNIEFWTDLQILHDSNSYWNEFGLSKEGQHYYEDLKVRPITMTKLEIIKETVEHYSSNPLEKRALLNGLCVYTDKEGAHCAIGRCLLPEYQTTDFIGNERTLAQNLSKVAGKEDLDSLLQEKYRGHDENFWFDLQHLHDTEQFWNLEEGLTELGEDYISKINRKYKHKN